ncbi:hypothetical protein [Copranaerobaculum intestinale]|nr:hypothetical protein [Copranaerobaculum intestinale]
MNKRKINVKLLYLIVLVIYILTLLYSFATGFFEQNWNRVGMTVVSVLCLLIIPVVFKIFRWKPVYEIYVLGTCFMYFASLIGSCLGGYSVRYFDKVVHLCSGIFATLLAIMLFSILKKVRQAQNKEDYHLLLVFVNAVNLAIAVIWEFYEYAMLIFFNNDAINHYTQGVHDTITDMMSACVGGLFVTMILIHRYRTQKSNFLINVPERFYEKNIAHHRQRKMEEGNK